MRKFIKEELKDLWKSVRVQLIVLMVVLIIAYFTGMANAWSDNNLYDNNFNGVCIQETANATNENDSSCGQTYTGNYTVGGVGTWSSFGSLVDGNKYTFGYCNADFGLSCDLYVNYSKPNNANVVNATWEIEYLNNVSILDTCYALTDVQLRLKYFHSFSGNYIQYHCYNGTWNLLSVNSGLGAVTAFAEERIKWNFDSLGNYSIENLTFSQSILNITRYIRIPSGIGLLTNAFLNITGFNYTSSLVEPIFPFALGDYWRMNNGTATTDTQLSNSIIGRQNLSNYGNGCQYNQTFGFMNGSYYCGNSGPTGNTNKLLAMPYNWTNTENMTINLWFNINANNSKGNYILYYRNSTTIKFTARYSGGGLFVGADGVSDNVSNSFIRTLGNWTMLTVVVNKTRVYYYINGTYANETSFYTLDQNDTFAFGGDFPLTDDRSLNGWIDEISITNQSLTQAQITSLYNSYLNSSFISTNVSINISNTNIFNSVGQFVTTNRTGNLIFPINNYLSSCTYIGGYCFIPVTFYSSTVGTIQYNDLQFDNVAFIENNQTFNLTTYETALEHFSLNMTFDNSTYTITTANLVYNNTNYAATVSNVGANTIVSRDLLVPVGVANNTFYWSMILTNATLNTYVNSTMYNQSVKLLNMSLCGQLLNTTFLNYTFHNDTLAKESVKSTFVGSFVYWLSNITINKTYSFTNSSENWNYNFCFTPNTTIYVSGSGTYGNSASQTRSFSNSSMPVTYSTITVQDLLLLPTSNGIYITFIVQNAYGQRIQGALIDIKKTSDGTPVEQKTTDGTGIAAFWLDTTQSYTVTVSKTDYTTYSTSITPATSPITITLSASATTTTTNPMDDIELSIYPQQDGLENGTNYIFKLVISGGDKTLERYGFYLWNRTAVLSTDKFGELEDGGTVSYTYNTGNQSYIVMKYYFVVDGDYTNGTKIWYVADTSGTDTSIANFINDLNYHLGNSSNSTGIFGVKKGTASGDFTLAILIFLVTFFLAGMMTYKYGITSTTAIIFMIFAIVLFFDVGANLVPNPMASAIPHAPTWLMGIIAIGYFIREMVS